LSEIEKLEAQIEVLQSTILQSHFRLFLMNQFILKMNLEGELAKHMQEQENKINL
jgi:hypothetical protein